MRRPRGPTQDRGRWYAEEAAFSRPAKAPGGVGYYSGRVKAGRRSVFVVSRRSRSGDGGEGLLEIGEQVAPVFDAGRRVRTRPFRNAGFRELLLASCRN